MSDLIWVTLLFAIRGTNAEPPHELKTPEPGFPHCVTTRCHSATNPDRSSESALGSKCEQNCTDSDVLIQLNITNPKAKSGLAGEVSLLGLILSHRNCSIIVFNNLSKSYELTIQNGTVEVFNSSGVAVDVNVLTQKPTVLVPTLTEGQQATLTCTAPGLCSGSVPEITWMWSGPGQKDSYITDFRTENLTASGQIHNSTLTFNSSAAHHGAEVTCKVIFMKNITTEETVTLNVTYLKKPEISGQTTVKLGDTLNLTCIGDSFPPCLITWTKLLHQNLSYDPGTHQFNDTGKATVVIANVTGNDSGRYICTAKHVNHTMTKEVNITVIDVKTANISGITSLEEEDTLNLTCTVESVPPMHVKWTGIPSRKNVPEETRVVQNNTVAVQLLIANVTAEHSGQYICTANHLNMTLTMQATVALHPKILNTSGCRRMSELLTCECVSRGFPVPDIKWPLLENFTDYSVLTNISSHTVKSSITLTVRNQSVAAVECVSSNGNKEANMNLTIRTIEEDSWLKLLIKRDTWPDVIIAFCTGALLSSVFCCCIGKCHRKKQKIYRGLAETLEMMPSHEEPLIDAGQAEEEYQAIGRAAAEAEGDEAKAAEAQATNQEAAEAKAAMVPGMSDTEYCDLDFSLMKQPSLVQELQQTPETEYAEIKKEKVKVRQDGESKEEDEKIGEDEVPKCCAPSEEEGDEAAALYSTVKDVMNEV